MTVLCVRCGAPTADAYLDLRCASELAQRLSEAAGHAEDAETVISRQTRYGAGGRSGSGEPLPVDLTAADRLRTIGNTLTTWARVVFEERHGIPIAPTERELAAQVAHAARYIARYVEWLRHHPAAGEAFDDLERACRDLARLVDRPADKELVGVCDCGKVLYAARGRPFVTCPMPTCKLVWNVAESRDILRRHLGDKLVTASEAARLSAYMDTDRTQEQIRKLINKWAERGELAVHWLRDEQAYRFSEVATRIAATTKRERRADPIVAAG